MDQAIGPTLKKGAGGGEGGEITDTLLVRRSNPHYQKREKGKKKRGRQKPLCNCLKMEKRPMRQKTGKKKKKYSRRTLYCFLWWNL